MNLDFLPNDLKDDMLLDALELLERIADGVTGDLEATQYESDIFLSRVEGFLKQYPTTQQTN